MTFSLTVRTDGGCRDNPGPGAWAFVISPSIEGTQQASGFLPYTTNNQAEYRALEAACILLSRQTFNEAPERIEILSDSQLIVEQINRRWQVKDQTLRPFFEAADEAFKKLNNVYPATLRWIPREENKEADALCNLVMDRRGIACTRVVKSKGKL